MSFFIRIFATVLLLLPLCGHAHTLEEVLRPFVASYQGRANGLAVSDLGTRELKSLGNGQYQLQYRASAMIYSLEETSIFEIQNGIILPLSYRSDRGSFFKRRKASLNFDWDKKSGSYEYKGDSGAFKLEAGVQDPLTGSLELALLLSPDRQKYQYNEAEKKGIGSNELMLIDQPELKTAMGTIKTWHLERIHKGNKRKTEIWLHYEYPSIPVKVHQTDDGDDFQLNITKFELK